MKMYAIGFIVSLVLTLAAFGLTSLHVDSRHASIPHEFLIPIIIGLAVAQLITQLLFFVHLGRESKPRLHLVSFLFMLLVLVIVVGGSLWIMANLDYNMMHHSDKVEEYLLHDEGIHTHE